MKNESQVKQADGGRVGKTRRGVTVPIGKTIATLDGWYSWILDRRGVAVSCFVPSKGGAA